MNVDFVLYYDSGNSSERALNFISIVSGDLVGCITNFFDTRIQRRYEKEKGVHECGFLESPSFDQSVPRQV